MIENLDKDLLNHAGRKKPTGHQQHTAHIADELGENDDPSDDLLSDEAKIPDRVRSQLEDLVSKLRDIIPGKEF